MNRIHRVIAPTMLAAAAFAACHKKQDVAPPPEPAARPTETCNQACRDSIAAAEEARRRAAAEAARRDSIAAAERARAAAVATLKAQIFFDYDMSNITDASRAGLDAKLPILRKNPAVRLRISGHCDERGSDAYNLALGQRRAAAAKRYLTDQGIDPSRIEIVSWGEARPAVQGSTEDAYRQNRRDEFEIVAGEDNITSLN